jgi:hypothetical protein
MKKAELKKVLKPLIKECIKECIFEEGVLSGIITEVAHGLGDQRLQAKGITLESKQNLQAEEVRRKQEEYEKQRKERIRRLNESSKTGVDIFKNTAPIPEQSSVGSPLAGTSPDDEGVDITGIIGLAKGKWKHLI